jgi:predicted ATP-dependent endonuclease of OLD family
MANQSYIKHVQLKGYKSIKNLEADFLPGLNIIIGDNGSGKSNFFKFIDKCWNKDYADFDEPKAIVKYWGNGNFGDLVWETKQKNTHLADYKDFGSLELTQYEVKGPDIVPNNLQFIEYGVPEKSYLLGDDIILTHKKDNSSSKINIDTKKSSRFLAFAIGTMFTNEYLKGNDSITDQSVYDDFTFFLNKSYKSFLESIPLYSPVKEVRLNKSLRVASIDAETIEIRNIVLEYFINGEWYSWSGLSDGTKRIIYTIFLTCGLEVNNIRKSLVDIILLEEPEIGIHPNQLHLLMQFLKERSEVQQIFISTHSPQVLDILGEDDLNRITIAEIQPKEGTKFRKLNEQEIAKAKDYIKDTGFLSDYWQYADLQKPLTF